MSERSFEKFGMLGELQFLLVEILQLVKKESWDGWFIGEKTSVSLFNIVFLSNGIES